MEQERGIYLKTSNFNKLILKWKLKDRIDKTNIWSRKKKNMIQNQNKRLIEHFLGKSCKLTHSLTNNNEVVIILIVSEWIDKQRYGEMFG